VIASSVRPFVSSPKIATVTTATIATAPMSRKTALTPPASSSRGTSDGPMTPENRRPTPSVTEVPVALTEVG
jgi:hypothetical protein